MLMLNRVFQRVCLRATGQNGTSEPVPAVIAEPKKQIVEVSEVVKALPQSVGHTTLVIDCSTSISVVAVTFVAAFAHLLSMLREQYGEALLMTLFGMHHRIWKIVENNPVTGVREFKQRQFELGGIWSLLEGGTHLLDAICQSCEHALSQKGDRVIAILTDGFNRDGQSKQTSSYEDAREWLQLAREDGITVRLVGFVSLEYQAKLRKFIDEVGFAPEEVLLVYYNNDEERDAGARTSMTNVGNTITGSIRVRPKS